jgi:hypothetical protein
MRIIENQDARRFSCEATLYDFSDLDVQLTEDIRLEFDNPVPVYSPSRTKIPVGYAHVYADEKDQKLKAEIFVDYAIPERLSVQMGDIPVYAIPDGDFSINCRSRRVGAVWLPQIYLGGRQESAGVGGRVRLPNEI